MGKMKRLMIDLIEYDSEIEEVLTRIQSTMPNAFKLLVDPELDDRNKKLFIDKFTENEELTELVLVTLEIKSNEMSKM